MSAKKPFTCRGVRTRKRSATVALVAMLASTFGGNSLFVPSVVHAQTAPTGQGFVLDAEDLRFIYHQIEVAQDHAAGGVLLGPGPNQVQLNGRPDPLLPIGLRTVDGSFNNLVAGQAKFGSADQIFPRLLVPNFRTAETLPFDPDGPGGQDAGSATSYSQKKGFVSDSQPRMISNLIVDQSATNLAAEAAAANPCGSGGFVCGGSTAPDPVSGALFIPNITPDFGLSAPYNLMFAFFGQFFDHGLDLVTKGGGSVIMPLKADDPLFVAGGQTNFMVMTRATNLPGPDGVLGDNPATPQDESADDVQEGVNTTTPWVDQNQTYTSHPSHQVFLRQYVLNAAGKPVGDGRVLDGSNCSPRGTGIPGDVICNIGNWAEVKAQAANKLGILLADSDIFDAPLILTDPYGHFKPGLNGFAQLVLPGNALLEGNPAVGGVAIPANAFRTGHAFLNDIAHSAVPTVGGPDADLVAGGSLDTPSPAGTYDNELLDRHFITGDGRGNENIGLTTVHQIFHAEHNRLVSNIDRLINTPGFLTPGEVALWTGVHSGSGWDYGERLFQAGRFVTEMEYQHLVFEEFARKIQPLIDPFVNYTNQIDPAIAAEFAHTVYRLGHSMLPEVISRINTDGTVNDIRLFDAFLNPVSFNDGGAGVTLTAAQAAGSVVRGLSRQVGNELDEFVTDSVRNRLVGLPLDLPAINIARGRSEGIPSLNSARRQFFNATRNSAVAPYANWFEFGLILKHQESLVNFVAAYGTDPTIMSATTMADKRAAAKLLVAANGAFMFAPAATSGLDDVDFWVGGLAERQAVFGGLLGSTFNFVFEKQLEELQNNDRFYYLGRTDGLNLRTQLEGNSLSEMIQRNSEVQGLMFNVFETADYNIDVASFPGTATVDLGDGSSLITLFDGTKLFFDPMHRGKNIVFNGTSGDDRMRSDIGDDTIYGNQGNDRIEGGEGNDHLFGGDGDDIITDAAGDDVLEGGNGNDALSAGPGFGADLVLGGSGNDFVANGPDATEVFGGPDNDFILDGSASTEGLFGGPGDDWIDAANGHDVMFGDNGNSFDILAGLDPVGGDDVLVGGPGQDNHFGEGGSDIFIMNEGADKYFGDYGFDFITQRGWPAPADIELDLFALPVAPINFNDTRPKYRLVDGASGWNLNDHIRGNHLVNDPAAPPEFFSRPGMELTAAFAAKVSGLAQLIAAFGKTLPFNAGNILTGGAGSDLIEGKGGDDLIDGDVWLNVQLEATMNPVGGAPAVVKLVNTVAELADDVFADPQRLNPGNIRIVRSIVTPVVPVPDCGAAAPINCDVAVFTGPRADYSILNAGGIVTVAHTAGIGFGVRNDGTDTLRNIERIQFADVTITAPGAGAGSTTTLVPAVVGLTQALAVGAITGASLVASATSANSPTVPIGSVISQSPAAGTSIVFGGTVAIVVASGTLVPGVVGSTQTAATAAIAAAGLTVGSVTAINSATPAGIVLSQAPAAGTTTAPGTAMALTVSLGPANVIVPNVVSLSEAAAITSITGVGLTAGTRTTGTSTTIAAGNVISTNPAAGASVPPGSAVAYVVSTGAPTVLGLVAAFGFDEGSGTIAINSVNAAFHGTIREAIRTSVTGGKIGKALSFDGVNDWVTVTDVTASPLDLSTGMTLEAWVNPATLTDSRTIMVKERTATGVSYMLYANDDVANVAPKGIIRTGGINQEVLAPALALNTWTHVATTYDGATQRIYINGVLRGQRAQTGLIAVANGPLRIGGNLVFGGEFFHGLIDEVRVYNRALSGAEIITDMTKPIVP